MDGGNRPQLFRQLLLNIYHTSQKTRLKGAYAPRRENMEVELKSLVTEQNAVVMLAYTGTTGKIHTRQAESVRMKNETKYHMELRTILAALKLLKPGYQVRIRPMGIQIESALKCGWVEKWKNQGWKNAKGKKPPNAELWAEVLQELEDHPYQIGGRKCQAEQK